MRCLATAMPEIVRGTVNSVRGRTVSSSSIDERSTSRCGVAPDCIAAIPETAISAEPMSIEQALRAEHADMGADPRRGRQKTATPLFQCHSSGASIVNSDEAAAWQMTGEELLERLWQYLRTPPGA
jgi:hypothetical protein